MAVGVRPPYKFSVWVKTGNHEDRKVSTFTRAEAEAWRNYLINVFTDRDQAVIIKDRDY